MLICSSLIFSGRHIEQGLWDIGRVSEFHVLVELVHVWKPNDLLKIAVSKLKQAFG